MNRYMLGLMVVAVLMTGCKDTTGTDQSIGAPQYSNNGKSDEDHGNGWGRDKLQKVKLVLPVTGTLPGGGTFAGEVYVKQFGVQNGALTVTGVLNGVATVGGVSKRIKDLTFTAPAEITEGTTTGSTDSPRMLSAGIALQALTCPILFLDLGPIFLDLLGLQLDLSRVILDLTAVGGAGNLVGNLLCLVANLLNLPIIDLAGLLDLIVDILNGLLA